MVIRTGMQMLNRAMPAEYPLFEEYVAAIERMVHDLRASYREVISASAYDTLIGIEISLRDIVEEALEGVGNDKENEND